MLETIAKDDAETTTRSRPHPFQFEIGPVARGWAWTAFDHRGQIAAKGVASCKAEAAACVIHELAGKRPVDADR